MAGEDTLAEPKLKVTHDTHLHTLTNVPTKCQPFIPYGSKKFLRQDFKTHDHYDKVKGQIKVTP